MNGPSLEQLLAPGSPLPLELAVKIVRQAAAALDYAHRKGVVHRDIKPGNIMLDEDQTVRICDFGIAKMVAGQVAATQAGLILGSPHYMAPEQIQGHAVDGRTDQFSLAVVTYRMMSGKLPHHADSMGRLFFQVLQEDPVPLDTLNPLLGQAAGAAVGRALSKTPADRFATCEEFARALEAACLPPPADPPVAAEIRSGQEPPPPPPPKRRCVCGAEIDPGRELCEFCASFGTTRPRDVQPSAHSVPAVSRESSAGAPFETGSPAVQELPSALAAEPAAGTPVPTRHDTPVPEERAAAPQIEREPLVRHEPEPTPASAAPPAAAVPEVGSQPSPPIVETPVPFLAPEPSPSFSAQQGKAPTFQMQKAHSMAWLLASAAGCAAVLILMLAGVFSGTPEKDRSGPANSAPGIVTAVLLRARVGESYQEVLQAEGGTPPYKWTVRPALPSGLRLDEQTGRIGGVPEESVAVYWLSFGVTDRNSMYSERQMMLHVAGAPKAPATPKAQAPEPPKAQAPSPIPQEAPRPATDLAIATFEAVPASIEQCKVAILRWTVTGAKSVSIEPGLGSVNPSSGYKVVRPLQTTQYTLRVINASGTTVSREVMLIVSSAGRLGCGPQD